MMRVVILVEEEEALVIANALLKPPEYKDIGKEEVLEIHLK